jgi:hypothetical protein
MAADSARIVSPWDVEVTHTGGSKKPLTGRSAAISTENCRTIPHRAHGVGRLHATRLDHREGQTMNWMHSCERVAELLSQSLDEPLGWFDALRTRIHLSMCSNCRNVEQQMLGVKALSADSFSSNPPMDSEVAASGAVGNTGRAQSEP